jgi:hypothetical protein
MTGQQPRLDSTALRAWPSTQWATSTWPIPITAACAASHRSRVGAHAGQQAKTMGQQRRAGEGCPFRLLPLHLMITRRCAVGLRQPQLRSAARIASRRGDTVGQPRQQHPPEYRAGVRARYSWDRLPGGRTQRFGIPGGRLRVPFNLCLTRTFWLGIWLGKRPGDAARAIISPKQACASQGRSSNHPTGLDRFS